MLLVGIVSAQVMADDERDSRYKVSEDNLWCLQHGLSIFHFQTALSIANCLNSLNKAHHNLLHMLCQIIITSIGLTQACPN